MTLPRWKTVLPVPPSGGKLHEAWMTSFEQPEARLLVEHLLPSLLNMRNELMADIEGRHRFFGELGTALEFLHDRLTVISSPRPAKKGEDVTYGHDDVRYPWLWRYVSHFTVGTQSPAVQHAKLWAFHWGVGEREFLELHVSSANLTTAAFKGQIQAGWQVCLALDQSGNPDNRLSWGELIRFLKALGQSAGDAADTRIQRLIHLLGRVKCPTGVTFVASIPGDGSAARQIQPFQPSALYVLTPTIGNWNQQTLAAWAEDAGIAQGKIHLKWISQRHPWAATGGWKLSAAACQALMASGVRLECLSGEAKFTEQHRAVADERWSHAKLYLLRSRRKRWLLVTSANWSIAAWGAGKKIRTDNFELGVIFETEWTDIEALGKPFDPPDTVPFCDCERSDDGNRKPALAWAQACWDGEQIELCARSSFKVPITACVTFSQAAGAGSLEKRVSLVNGTAVLAWKDLERTPLIAKFTQGDWILEVSVIDLRPHAEFEKTPLPEIDPETAQRLREEFLLQRYGGPAVEGESLSESTDSPRGHDGVASPAGYSVQAWLDARAAFNVIDHWQAALEKARRDPSLFERIRLDGQKLRALYERRQGAANALAVEELGWRLEEEKHDR